MESLFLFFPLRPPSRLCCVRNTKPGGAKANSHKSLHFCVIKGGMFTFVAFYGGAYSRRTNA